MSRSSSQLSQRYHRPHSRMKRPKSAAPCLYPETDVIFEDEVVEDCIPYRPHTSFHYYPEELEGGEVMEGVGEPEELPQDYSRDPDWQAWSAPEDPEPLRLAKKYGYGYRKPEKELHPHWIQWPQPPAVDKPDKRRHQPLRYHRPHPPAATHPSLAYSPQKRNRTCQCVYDPVISDTHYNDANMNRGMSYNDERSVIMHRGLSPRRAAPPVMPGRSLTHYGGFGYRDNIGSLDLAPPSYTYRGYNAAASRSMSRESRPMHRHLRAAKQEEGYLHNNSIYYSTTPNVSGYFIIHPDWVSERLSMRRSQSLLSF